MDGKKPAASIADEFFGRKEVKGGSSSSGYFSSVFPPASTVMGKDVSPSDLYWTLNRQRGEYQIGNTHDGKSQESPTKKQTTCNKDGKPNFLTESTEAPYFGSSVHYGARDFYSSSPPKHVAANPKSNKNDDEDESSATRGNWWQGSLYY
ncbi:uncharacterized protein [Typha latifolia]|uniref:uncharacterized protein n=1 Tax=Typha latifolia TaxID=4733 RepID=UPI003C2EF871